MKLYFYDHQNFGDALNPFLWNALLPGIFDGDERELFVGIGTLLNDGVPRRAQKYVFGSGVGYGSAPPVMDARWKIYWVRGPLTARALGLDENAVITDGAALLRTLDLPPARKTNQTVFMPHWRSTAFWDWREVCRAAGLTYVDPCAPVPEVLDALRGAKLVIAEALHGAIAADAFRVPWVPMRAYRSVLVSKWEDWCGSMGLAYQPVSLPPLYSAQSIAARFKGGGSAWARAAAAPAGWLSPLLVARAVKTLQAIEKNSAPRLSGEKNLARAIERMQAQLARFSSDLRNR
jgi:succinoglycan biosynthesis protein ExoV